jgi:drug/metabolite transporter (DMT)-like permease
VGRLESADADGGQALYEPVSFIVWTSVFPMLPLLLLSLWVDGAGFGDFAAAVHRLERAWSDRLSGLLSTLLGYGLWTRLLQRYAASTVAPLSLLVPVIGLLLGHAAAGRGPMACNGWVRWAFCWAWWSTSLAANGGAEIPAG